MKHILLIILFGFLTCVAAQSRPNELKFRHLTLQNGLRSNAIHFITQDHDGFLWIGGENGLHKYDGYSFTVFSNDENDTTSLRDNNINGIIEDNDKNLWIGTNSGLDLYNRKNNNFYHVSLIAENEVDGKIQKQVSKSYYINNIFKDKNDNIYIGTRDNSIFILDKKNKCIRNFDRNLKPAENLVRSADVYGNIYISSTKGAYKLNVSHRKIEKIELFNNLHEKLTYEAYFIFADANSNIWIATDIGLYRIEPKTSRITCFKRNPGDSQSIPDYFITYIYEDKFRNIWFCSNKGLFTYNSLENNFNVYPSSGSDDLSSNRVRCVFVDDRGILWVGTGNNGIDYAALYNANQFNIKKIIYSQRKSENIAASVFYKDDKENIWIGTDGDGLRRFNKNFNEPKTFLHNGNNPGSIGTNNVLSIFQDRKGDLWFGGFYGGLSKYNNRGGFYNYQLGTFYPPGLKNLTNEIKDIIEDDNQSLLVAMNGAGIFSFNTVLGKGKYYINEPGNGESLSSNWCTSLCKDKEGIIWIGTYYGLNRWDPKTNVFKKYFHNDKDSSSLSSDAIYTVYNDRENNLWIGTNKGLCLFIPKTGKFKIYKQKEGLQDIYITNIVEDQEGNLWMSTLQSISKFDVKHNRFTNYTYDDGLSGNLFTNNGCFKDNDGVIYFAGTDGITYFNPQKFSDQKQQLLVYITDFQIFNKTIWAGTKDSPLKGRISTTSEIVLNHNQSFISFKYVCINYLNPNRIEYAYKLEGFDNDWHYVGGERVATYSNLDPGKYIFIVKASARDGLWYYPSHEITVIVKPPMWKTIWAYLFYVIIVYLIIHAIVKFLKVKYRLQHQVAQERLKAEQEQQLHNLKLQFFTNISHDLRTPLSLVISPLENILSFSKVKGDLRGQLSMAVRNANKLFSLVNELMDFTKSENNKLKILAQPGDIVKFSKEIFAFFSTEALRRQIDYQFVAYANNITAWFDRDKLERIILNLLSNAFKFTRDQGQIKVEIGLQEGMGTNNLWISISDNGSGISNEYVDKVFDRFFQSPEADSKHQTGTGIGLSLVKNLVELHHGTISVTSEKWVKTCFTVLLPLGNSHFLENEILTGPADINLKTTQSQIIDNEVISPSNAPLILVVEDNLELRSYICSVLKKNYQVIEAEDGLKGFALAKEHVPDLIVSDIVMPEMSGTEMCEKIKKEISISHVPVILLTAKATLDDQIAGLETGADAYITKPFNVKFLEVSVKKLIENRRLLYQRFSQEAYIIPKEISNNQLDQKFLQRIIDYIDQNISNENLTMESIAEHVFLSQSQTYRKIKALTGQNINEFVRTIRLKKAIKLFDMGENNISEVAFKVGFSSSSYFSKCFHKQFSKTPSDFLAGHKK